MRRTKYTFIHKDIHDYRQPVIVPVAYIRQLRKWGEITAKEKKAALSGQEITVMGYRIVGNKKLSTKFKQ